MNEDIKNTVIETYNNNLNFLEKYDYELFKIIKLFEAAIEFGEIKERYLLEYSDNYFDVYDDIEKIFIYSCDSNKYSEELVANVNFDSRINTFKTFYDIGYEDDVVEQAKKVSILSSNVFGITPVIHYVNKNLPSEENMKIIYNYIIFGVILRLHIPKIHKKINAEIYHIIEPSLELFRLPLFVTDYSEIVLNKIYFYVAVDEESFHDKIKKMYYKIFSLFSQNYATYINSIQNFLVLQNHYYLFSFNRELMSLSRTYKYLQEEFNEFMNNLSVFLNNFIQKTNNKIVFTSPALSAYNCTMMLLSKMDSNPVKNNVIIAPFFNQNCI